MPKYQAHSPTSAEAAVFAEGFSASAREAVLLHILRNGGATDEECQHTLCMNPNTQRPRRVELVEAGLVEDSGHVRPTASGMDAVVWVATGERYFHSMFVATQRAKNYLARLEEEVLTAARRYANNPSGLTRFELLRTARKLK